MLIEKYSKTFLLTFFLVVKWAYEEKFLDAGIQDVSTSIPIVHNLTEMSYGTDDESDKHI